MSSETLAGVFRPVRPGRDCSRTVGGEEGKKTPLSVCQQASRMDGGPPLQAKPRSAASLSLRMSLDPSLERLVSHERLHSRPAFHVTTGVFRTLLAMHVSASARWSMEHLHTQMHAACGAPAVVGEMPRDPCVRQTGKAVRGHAWFAAGQPAPLLRPACLQGAGPVGEDGPHSAYRFFMNRVTMVCMGLGGSGLGAVGSALGTPWWLACAQPAAHEGPGTSPPPDDGAGIPAQSPDGGTSAP